MRVLVGSTRPAKVDGAREALGLIAGVDARFRDADLQPLDLTDVAPRMPMSAAEVLAGARLRAETLARRAGLRPGLGFAVGLEGGLDPVDVGGEHTYALVTWAAVTDGEAWGYGAGGAVLIPAAVAAEVEAGAELGDVMDRRAGASIRGHRGAWGMLTRDLVGRRDAFRVAVVAAFARFYNPELY